MWCRFEVFFDECADEMNRFERRAIHGRVANARAHTNTHAQHSNICGRSEGLGIRFVVG
jgi:hypothetical protein